MTILGPVNPFLAAGFLAAFLAGFLAERFAMVS